MMTKLIFTDGEEFDTSGPLRVDRRYDGLYVIGMGMLVPVNSEEEAVRTIKRLEETCE